MKAKIYATVILLIVAVNILYGQSITHPWKVIDRSGGKSIAGEITLHASIGQPAVQAMSASGYNLAGGYIPGVRATTTVTVYDQWNLVSNPTVDARLRSELYPEAISEAFSYSSCCGYVVKTTLVGGEGYWLKFPSDLTLEIEGSGNDSLTIPVSSGWNLVVPSLDESIMNTMIEPIGTQFISRFFAYRNGYYHVAPESLKPGQAAWVKVSSDGKIRVSHTTGATAAGNTPRKTDMESNFLSSLNRLDISDPRGSRQELYFGKRQDDAMAEDHFELPPPPPAGNFDVRFSSNRFVELYPAELKEANKYRIALSAENYPLTVEVRVVESDAKNMSISSLVDGREVSRYNVKDNTKITIDDPKVKELVLRVDRESSVPVTFALHQSYPNPFNPTAVIAFDLPRASLVTLNVFDMLGREVATLVERKEYDAGTHQLEFNGENFASGVYMYRIVAQAIDASGIVFQDVRKMMLMK